MQRWFFVMALIAVLLAGVVPAAAQGPEADLCMQKGGTWDAEQGACIVAAQIEISVAYPLDLIGLPYAEQAIDDFLAEMRVQFLGGLVEYGLYPSPGPLVQELDYELFEHGDRYISLLYTIYEYTGGAHGNTVFHTFIFDHFEQRALDLENLFADTTAALEVIAPLVQADLHAQMGEMADAAWIAAGAGPDPENYRNVVLTPDALVFYFPPYQVAAYAAGPFTVALPLADVAGLLAISLAE